MAEIDMKEAAVFLFAGAMVGAAVALLYATNSDTRTIRDIKKVSTEEGGSSQRPSG